MKCKWTIFAVVGLAALAAGLASCEKPEPFDSLTGVVLRQADLDQMGGSTFVSVTCKGAWNLVVECSDGGSWATVSLLPVAETREMCSSIIKPMKELNPVRYPSS